LIPVHDWLVWETPLLCRLEVVDRSTVGEERSPVSPCGRQRR
jgi:hypothetical protein